MTAKDMFSHCVSILTGHYGTGKTEVSLNGPGAGRGEQVMLADLDIVNPISASERRPSWKSRCAGDFSQACSDADVRPAGGAADHSGDQEIRASWISAAIRWAPAACFSQDRTGGLPADLRPTPTGRRCVMRRAPPSSAH